MRFIFRIFVLFFLIFQGFVGYCQNNDSKKKPFSLERKVYDVFSQSDPGRVLKDSVSIYAINFTLTIVKKSNVQTIVTKIIANDSLGYRMFPTYKQLGKINYINLMGSNREVTFLIPILLYRASLNTIKYKDDSGATLINMQAAINAIYALASSSSYNNLKDANEDLKYRLQDKYLKGEDVFEKLIVARPMIWDLSVIKN